jgi:Fat storage-inducing transmembrane protein
MVILGIWWFSLMNTAVYFHTLLEKTTGLIFGMIGWCLVDVLTPMAIQLAGLPS